MSKHFSANQYEGAFKSSHLQNWQIPNSRIEQRPNKYEGFSVFISDDRGYLLNNTTRSKKSPWGGFVGTWDMPKKIPGNNVLNATARDPSSAKTLKKMKEEFEQKIKSGLIPNMENQRNRSTKPNEEVSPCNCANNAEIESENVCGSKPQTPKTTLNETYGSPSLNKVTVPTPLGLQDPDVAMKSSNTSSRESTQREIGLKQGVNFKEVKETPPTSSIETQVEKPSTPKTPLQDPGSMKAVEQALVQSPAPLSDKRVTCCSPCPSRQVMKLSKGPIATINWPEPKALTQRTCY